MNVGNGRQQNQSKEVKMAADRETKNGETHQNRKGKFSISVGCQWCGTFHYVEVFREDWLKYQEGAFVQDAFPYMAREIREMFVSNTCPECWKRIFAKKA
jgi:hypothetical protein